MLFLHVKKHQNKVKEQIAELKKEIVTYISNFFKKKKKTSSLIKK